MKKNIILVLSSIALGILFTFFILNKKDIYAKEEYSVYAFQIGAYSSYENASKPSDIPKIVINEDGLYKVYVAIYKDNNIINTMLKYFNSKNISVYLKMLKVNKDFYHKLSQYEELFLNLEDDTLYKQINESILNLYLESKNDLNENS